MSDQIDTGIHRLLREVALMREYRTRLITDLVTGKFDVREEAARMPEEIEEPEPVDESDDRERRGRNSRRSRRRN